MTGIVTRSARQAMNSPRSRFRDMFLSFLLEANVRRSRRVR